MSTKEALQQVVDLLDKMMTEAPSRELADTSNFLQAMLDNGDYEQ